MYADGSIQGIDEIPAEIRRRYRTVYEVDFHDLIDMMSDRSAFVSQSGSFNHYTSYSESGPTLFTQKVLYAWKKGLKSLSYYMHTESASTAKKEFSGMSRAATPPLSISIPNTQDEVKIMANGQACDMSDPDCEFCSS
jgi:ribonucleoside-diphosphate reductase alpha chain